MHGKPCGRIRRRVVGCRLFVPGGHDGGWYAGSAPACVVDYLSVILGGGSTRNAGGGSRFSLHHLHRRVKNSLWPPRLTSLGGERDLPVSAADPFAFAHGPARTLHVDGSLCSGGACNDLPERCDQLYHASSVIAAHGDRRLSWKPSRSGRSAVSSARMRLIS